MPSVVRIFVESGELCIHSGPNCKPSRSVAFYLYDGSRNTASRVHAEYSFNPGKYESEHVVISGVMGL